MVASIYHAMQAARFAARVHASNEISIKDYIVGAGDALNCVRAYITSGRYVLERALPVNRLPVVRLFAEMLGRN